MIQNVKAGHGLAMKIIHKQSNAFEMYVKSVSFMQERAQIEVFGHCSHLTNYAQPVTIANSQKTLIDIQKYFLKWRPVRPAPCSDHQNYQQGSTIPPFPRIRRTALMRWTQGKRRRTTRRI